MPAPRPLAARHPLAALVLAAATALALAGCGTTEDAAPAGSSAPAEAGPVVVVDGRGVEVELPDGPATRVVATEWNVAEHLVSLGVMPVGVADTTNYPIYVGAAPLDEDVTDIGTRGEPSIDTIATLAPDLIVATADLPEDAITQLEDIAPTIVVTSADAGDQLGQMTRNVELVAEATGTEDEAEQLLADLDAKIEDGAAAIAAAGYDGSTLAYADGYVYEGAVTIRPFTEGSLIGSVAAELGLTSPWSVEGDAAYGLGSIDVEGLTGLETDFLVLASASPDLQAELEGNPVYDSLPVVRADDVVFTATPIWAFGGPASMMQEVDELVAAVGA